MEAKGLIAKHERTTLRKIANILLTLVATTSSKHSTNEKIPERVTNIIKATALTIENMSTYALTPSVPASKNNTANQPPHDPLTHGPSLNNLHRQLETNINFLKVATSSQAEATEKANALLGKLELICNQAEAITKEIERSAKTTVTSATAYKDALINGKTPEHPVIPQSLNQCKALN